MHLLRIRVLCIVATLGLLCGPSWADRAQDKTASIVAAANHFLTTLDDQQRSAVTFKFTDKQQRARWSNLPVAMVPRAGLSMGSLTDAQRSAAMALLQAMLSERGIEKVRQIMDADELLKTQPNDRGPRGGPRGGGPGGGGGGPMFGKDLYFISFLGTPSEKEPWMVQFGGHHLALNITFTGEHGVLAPSLIGAQPALYQVDGKTVRPLGPESDLAFELLESLDENQRKTAILGFRVSDLVLGPGHDGETIQPEGLKASAMNDMQKAKLLDLITQWAGIVDDAYAKPRMAEIKAGLEDTYFAWSGPTIHEPGKNGRAYYRVQGPKLVIEYAPQNLGGDPTLHVHTMYRDPTNDYGRANTSAR